MIPKVAFFDAKSYDREYFDTVSAGRLDLRYFRFSLNADLAQVAEGTQAVCAFVHDDIDRRCLEELQKIGVRHVAMRCAGYNKVDVETARSLDIQVTRVPAYSPAAVAEHAVALLLTLNRRIHRAFNRIREHNFSLNGFVGFDLAGKTVGIVGCGKIGRTAAQIFRGFGTRVLAYDPEGDEAWATHHGIELTDLDSLWKNADVISLHVPLLPATRYLVRAESIAQMKPGVILINTSRGELVKTDDLIAALRARQIGGVCLDVYEEEDGYFYSDHSDTILDNEQLAYLLTFPNVLVTSHQAFLTAEALTQIATVTTENILAIAAGKSATPGTAL
ncbi:MAG: 2-hydroxyacid dehydrogenase [Chthoniobacterales bacterium]